MDIEWTTTIITIINIVLYLAILIGIIKGIKGIKGIPVGFISMLKADYENNSIHFGFVIIDSSKRNKGFGKQMMKQATRYAFEILNVSRVTLKVFDNNSIAHACYQDVGFVDEKYLEKVFPYKDEMWGCYDMAIEK